MERNEELQIEFPYRALAEAQQTVKFTDTKAGSIILLVGGLLAFIGAIHTGITTLLPQILTTIILASLVLSAACAMSALQPRVNPENFIDFRGVKVTPLYHLRTVTSAARWRAWFPFSSANRLNISAAEYLRQLDALDGEALRHQLAFELLKVSFIREEKIFQVTWAVRFMQVAGGFLALLVFSLYVFS
jgi:hypothetical protein